MYPLMEVSGPYWFVNCKIVGTYREIYKSPAFSRNLRGFEIDYCTCDCNEDCWGGVQKGVAEGSAEEE